MSACADIIRKGRESKLLESTLQHCAIRLCDIQRLITLRYTKMPESPARPRLPQRGELPSLPEGGGLQRRKRATPVRDRSSTGSNSTNKPSVTASSDPSNRTVADEHYGSTSIGHVYSPPGSAVQVTGSRQMTSPFEGFVGIPPNLFELKQLKQRVVDFDRLSIKSSEGNERSPPSVLVLNSFRLNKDRQMVSLLLPTVQVINAESVLIDVLGLDAQRLA